jgi:nucleoside-diphosphate-sugar epimerase
LLVTGGSGFLASHLVLELLSRGHRVRTTVRSLANRVKVAPLEQLSRRFPGQLEMFEADLLKEGSFDEAMAGCSVVFHVASPFLVVEQIKDRRRDLLEPIVFGARNVLASVARTPSVRRVVYTSTVGAIFGDYADVLTMPRRILTADHFNTTSTMQNNPYNYAKTFAEHEVWNAVLDQERWSLVVINPGVMIGPSFTPASTSGSLFLVDKVLRGTYFYGAPNFSVVMADVRDAAVAHANAAERSAAHGRYIVSHAETVPFSRISRIVRDHYPRRILVPRQTMPGLALGMVAGPRFGLTREYIRNHVGISFSIDNRRGVTDLGLTYRPLAETVLDHVAAWEANRNRSR